MWRWWSVEYAFGRVFVSGGKAVYAIVGVLIGVAVGRCSIW